MFTVGDAYWVIYVSLAFYACVALVGAYCMVGGGAEYWKSVVSPTGAFVGRGKSQSTVSLSLSLFATAMGIWALTAAPETSYFTGWLGLFGYAACTATPWVILSFIGPRVRNLSSDGITATDFVRRRYGAGMCAALSGVSIVNMWVAIAAELIGLGGAMSSLVPGFPPLGVTLPVAIVTIIYTSLSGFSASIATDRVQAVVAAPLILAVIITVFAGAPGEIPPTSWAVASTWTWEGASAAAVLLISVTLVEFCNQTTWQRIFSARDDVAVKWGLVGGSVLSFAAMVLFGLVGILAVAADDAGIVEVPPEEAYNSLFILLAIESDALKVIAATLAVCLACSSVDSFENAIVAVLFPYLPADKSVNWARLPGTLLALAAVPVAVVNPPSIMSIFMLSNIVGAALSPVVLLGLTPYVTSQGAAAGFGSGIGITVMIGWIRLKSFGGGFKWFLFPNGFYNWDALVTFILVPSVSALVALSISRLQFSYSPDLYSEQQTRLRILQLTESSIACEEPLPVSSKSCSDVGDSLTSIERNA